MACGDTYKSEIITIDGYTIENPYGSVALPGDYTGWRQLAERTFDRLEARWNQLGSEEPSPYEFWNANVEKKNALWERVDDLPSTIVASATGAGLTGGIDDAAKAIVDLNCFRERVDARIVELGIAPAKLPGAGVPKPAPERSSYPLGIHIGWWALAVGGAAFFLYRSKDD